MKKRIIHVIILTAVLFVSFAVFLPFQDSMAAFPEEGKIIRFIVPHKPGGGMDYYPRALQPFLKKHLPWKKGDVVVENIIGAGSVKGARELFFSEPDGYTIGTAYTRAVLFPQLLGKVVKFDVTKYTHLGQFNNFPSTIFTKKGHPFLKSFSDMKKPPRPIKFGFSSAGGIGHYYMLARKLNLNIKPVVGYKGSKESQLAVIRGEIDISMMTYSSIASAVKAGDVIPLAHTGAKPIQQDPKLPSFKDLGYEEFAGKVTVDRSILGPPNIPKERLEILQTAIWKALNDPGFVKVCKKSKRLLDVENAENTKRICLDIIRFWSPFGDELKKESEKFGHR